MEVNESEWYDVVAHTDLLQTLVLELVRASPLREKIIAGLALAVQENAETLLAKPVPDAQIAAVDRVGRLLLALLREP